MTNQMRTATATSTRKAGRASARPAFADGTLAWWLQQYATEVIPTRKGAAQEASMVKVLQASTLGGHRFAEINEKQISNLTNEWAETLKPATILRRIAFLSRVFAWVGVRPNPCDSVSKPSQTWVKIHPKPEFTNQNKNSTIEVRSRRVVDDEIARIAAASQSNLLPSVLWLAIELPLTRSEWVELTWSQVDWTRHQLMLPARSKAARYLPLSERSVSTLRKLADKARSTSAGEPVIPMRGDALTKALERARTVARETYASDCAREKVAPDPDFLANVRLQDLHFEASVRLARHYRPAELKKLLDIVDMRTVMRFYMVLDGHDADSPDRGIVSPHTSQAG